MAYLRELPVGDPLRVCGTGEVRTDTVQRAGDGEQAHTT
jgi:hypothetical protein